MAAQLLLTAAALSGLLLIAYATWHSLHGHASNLHVEQYAVYIDGGSSGTRVHVFKYVPAQWPAYVRLSLPEPSMAVEPGLSAYAHSPSGAANSLRPLLEFAMEKVPEEAWPSTAVRLLATAGLRLVTQQQAAAILVACRELLAASPFVFRSEWARVIDGQAEGLFGWAAVNYVRGALQEASGHHHHSRKEALEMDPASLFSGIMEMGGASMQVTFLPNLPSALPQQYGAALRLPGVSAPLYSHSYLGMGMDAALSRAAELVLKDSPPGAGAGAGAGRQQEQPEGLDAAANVGRNIATLRQGAEQQQHLVVDPCLPIGYVAEDGRVGNASFAACLELAAAVVPPLNCSTDDEDEDDVVELEEHATDLAAQQRRRRRPLLADLQEGAAAGSGGGSIRSGGARRMQAWHMQADAGTSVRQCTLEGALVPALSGSFIAMENFAWTARALGLEAHATLRELRDEAVHYCSRHWSSLHAQFAGHIPDQYLTRYCFGSAYILVLLHESFGIDLDDRRLVWSNTIRDPHGKDVGLNWVVGAALVEAMTGHGGWVAWLPAGSGGGLAGASALMALPIITLALLAVMLWVLRRRRQHRHAAAPVWQASGSGGRHAAADRWNGGMRMPSSGEVAALQGSPGDVRLQGIKVNGLNLSPGSRSSSYTSLLIAPQEGPASPKQRGTATFRYQA